MNTQFKISFVWMFVTTCYINASLSIIIYTLEWLKTLQQISFDVSLLFSPKVKIISLVADWLLIIKTVLFVNSYFQ